MVGSITNSRRGGRPSSKSLISSPVQRFELEKALGEHFEMRHTCRSGSAGFRHSRPQPASRFRRRFLRDVSSEMFCWRDTLPRKTSCWFSP